MPYQTLDELAADVHRFETCAFAPDEFTHARHIAVGMWHAAHLPYPEALAQMRVGLQRFLAHHGIAHGYHETLTVFWMRLLAHLRDEAGAAGPLHERVNEVIGRYGTMQPVYAHYRRETVFSDAAKAAWVEPDLHPLPF